MKAGFIGAGKVGFSLGKYLAENGIDVTGYYSRSADSAIKASEFTGTRYYKDLTDIIEDSDTLFITAPDGAITEVWEYIRNLPIKNKNAKIRKKFTIVSLASDMICTFLINFSHFVAQATYIDSTIILKSHYKSK